MTESLSRGVQSQLLEHLSRLYGKSESPEILERIEAILSTHQNTETGWSGGLTPLSERDVVLICYGDQIQRDGEPPLQTLAGFLSRRLSGIISTVHILPFFPYSSDDGFSVMDYTQVNPDLGSWEDVQRISKDFRLMIDAVINHISAQSTWFQEYLQGQPSRADYFIQVDPSADLSAVVRPRDLPLLTRFETQSGPQRLWTTFSEDQVDLNFANPAVLLEILEVLLFYIRQGAQIIRLDAIAFLWKEIGSPSIHLPETHAVVKLLRALLEAIAPGVLLITETNVPHEENITYFGDGADEAHLVYQFALPPLAVHTFLKRDARALTEWAGKLVTPSAQTAFFNFLASHDGIGLRPVQDLLSSGEVEDLLRATEARGGGVSYRSTETGERNPYELNISYLNALTDPEEFGKDPDRAVARFLCCQSIMLCLAGLPAIYLHSLIGSRNDLAGLARTGRLRSINREKVRLLQLEQELANKRSLRSNIFTGYTHLLAVRASQPAFHPHAPQEVFDVSPTLFTIKRTPISNGKPMLCLHEISGTPITVDLKPLGGASTGRDLLADQQVSLETLELAPYQFRWLELD